MGYQMKFEFFFYEMSERALWLTNIMICSESYECKTSPLTLKMEHVLQKLEKIVYLQKEEETGE